VVIFYAPYLDPELERPDSIHAGFSAQVSDTRLLQICSPSFGRVVSHRVHGPPAEPRTASVENDKGSQERRRTWPLHGSRASIAGMNVHQCWHVDRHSHTRVRNSVCCRRPIISTREGRRISPSYFRKCNYCASRIPCAAKMHQRKTARRSQASELIVAAN
jgi:hypothetical protein